MSFEISIVRPGECEKLRHVAREVFDRPVTSETLGRLLADPFRILIVAEAGGRVVGQLTAFRHRHPDERPDSIYIDEVGVSPAHQRQGIGKALIAHLLAHAARLGCRPAWVATEDDNHGARNLYARTAHTMLADVVVYEMSPDAPTRE